MTTMPRDSRSGAIPSLRCARPWKHSASCRRPHCKDLKAEPALSRRRPGSRETAAREPPRESRS